MKIRLPSLRNLEVGDTKMQALFMLSSELFEQWKV
ncbi:hypothetical protein QN277_012203 [Acacia crassicarpa]|uniref:Uncharacterized protein n=1 Tax=Acacia crassicarpa TaxID=499986 RepID=A0AAE1TEA7_9FABA|nr:hypothetical protein QN277_012203 [Acacia crassicarpa]